MIQLDVLSPDDWRRWRELRLRALAEDPQAFGSKLEDWKDAGEARWRERLSLPGSMNVIARLDGREAGMVSGVPSDAPRSAELISLWVAPEARGRGVGDALVDAVTRWAVERGARELRLDVAAGNAAATALYARHGFADAGPSREGCERAMLKRLDGDEMRRALAALPGAIAAMDRLRDAIDPARSLVVLARADVERRPELAWNAFVTLLGERELGELRDDQRPAALALHYDGCVSNGGHCHYFECATDDEARETVRALRALGAARHAAVLERAIAAQASDDDAAALEGCDADHHRARPPLTEILEAHLNANPARYLDIVDGPGCG